jgi:hypothetical protein
MDEIKAQDPVKNKDVAFIIENWIQITTEEAMEINPYLKIFIGVYIRPAYFYLCKQFDSEKNICLVHGNNQPYVCTGYTYYGKYKLFRGYEFYAPDCGYNKEENFYPEILKNVVDI